MKRKVIVISSNTQSRRDFNDVEVNTLADVKALLDGAGISYANQAFYEGVSKAEYTSDDSIMPSNMPFKGGVTNDLVFQLSNKSKKISSGANERRQRCFELIKKYGLAAKIKSDFGLMYTSVATDALERVIDAYEKETFYEKPTDEKSNDNFIASALLDVIMDTFNKHGYNIVKVKDDTVVSINDEDLCDIL